MVVVGGSSLEDVTRISGLDLHVAEKTIYGSFFGSTDPRREFPRLLNLYKRKQLKVEELISGRYRLDQINEGYESLLKGGFKRGVIVFD